jgi:hypothetical protein
MCHGGGGRSVTVVGSDGLVAAVGNGGDVEAGLMVVVRGGVLLIVDDAKSSVGVCRYSIWFTIAY